MENAYMYVLKKLRTYLSKYVSDYRKKCFHKFHGKITLIIPQLNDGKNFLLYTRIQNSQDRYAYCLCNWIDAAKSSKTPQKRQNLQYIFKLMILSILSRKLNIRQVKIGRTTAESNEQQLHLLIVARWDGKQPIDHARWLPDTSGRWVPTYTENVIEKSPIYAHVQNAYMRCLCC